MDASQPRQRNAVIPYLLVNDAPAVIDFAKSVLGAQVVEDLRHGDGSVWNAELVIGDSTLLVAEARGFGPHPGFLYVYVEDCDAAYRRALAAGAESMMAPADQFYGDRNAGVRDAAGNIWWIARHIETVPPEELRRRAAAQEAARAETPP